MPPPPYVSITRVVKFSAARRVESPALDEAENARLFGDDRRLHGREFTLAVTLRGEPPLRAGMVMDLKALSALLRTEVVARLDRSVLGGEILAAGWPPTTENLACAIWRWIEPRLPAGSLEEVALSEGDGKRVRYRGE